MLVDGARAHDEARRHAVDDEALATHDQAREREGRTREGAHYGTVYESFPSVGTKPPQQPSPAFNGEPRVNVRPSVKVTSTVQSPALRPRTEIFVQLSIVSDP